MHVTVRVGACVDSLPTAVLATQWCCEAGSERASECGGGGGGGEHMNRHGVEKSVSAIMFARDNCFKVDGHLMPDLPSTTVEKDHEMIAKVCVRRALCVVLQS